MNIDEQFEEVYNEACVTIDNFHTLFPREYDYGVWCSIVAEYEFACKVKALLDKVLKEYEQNKKGQ